MTSTAPQEDGRKKIWLYLQMWTFHTIPSKNLVLLKHLLYTNFTKFLEVPWGFARYPPISVGKILICTYDTCACICVPTPYSLCKVPSVWGLHKSPSMGALQSTPISVGKRSKCIYVCMLIAPRGLCKTPSAYWLHKVPHAPKGYMDSPYL